MKDANELSQELQDKLQILAKARDEVKDDQEHLTQSLQNIRTLLNLANSSQLLSMDNKSVKDFLSVIDNLTQDADETCARIARREGWSSPKR